MCFQFQTSNHFPLNLPLDRYTRQNILHHQHRDANSFDDRVSIDDTSPDGSITKALNGLTALLNEVAENSRVKYPFMDMCWKEGLQVEGIDHLISYVYSCSSCNTSVYALFVNIRKKMSINRMEMLEKLYI